MLCSRLVKENFQNYSLVTAVFNLMYFRCTKCLKFKTSFLDDNFSSICVLSIMDWFGCLCNGRLWLNLSAYSTHLRRNYRSINNFLTFQSTYSENKWPEMKAIVAASISAIKLTFSRFVARIHRNITSISVEPILENFLHFTLIFPIVRWHHGLFNFQQHRIINYFQMFEIWRFRWFFQI